MQAAMAEIVGKKELCSHLGWGRPRLDRTLERDKFFPVVSRGDQSGGWKFRKAEVDAYLTGDPSPKGIDLAQLRDAVKQPAPATAETKKRPSGNRLPPEAEATAVTVVAALQGASAKPEGKARKSAYHSGEASARQRKDDADASLKEDKLRELRGELVSKAEIRQALSTVFARLGHDLDGLPEKIVKALDLREDAAPGIRAMIDQVRTEMVRGAEALLAKGIEET
jgi:hypothetical protein